MSPDRRPHSALNVLVIDANERTQVRRADHLLLEDHEVSVAGAEHQARLKLASEQPDVAVLVSVGTPRQTLGLLRELRAGDVHGANPQMRVVTLGADSDPLATIHYKAGSDLALPSRVSPVVLGAAVQTLGERGQSRDRSRTLRVGRLLVDIDQHSAAVGDRSVKLTRVEFDLLHCLARSPQRTFSKAELGREVWGSEVMGRSSRTVDSHVSRLRHKLAQTGADGQLESVRGVGIRLSR
jgi:DNA-binding response OmpR family regulator